MAIVTKIINFRANDGTVDNGCLTPNGGDVYLELNRGYNCVIPNYGIAICTQDAAGNLQVETKLVDNGQFPPAGNPTAPAPLYRLGPADATLLNRCVVILANGATDSGVAGPITIVIRVLQKNPDATYRRAGWTQDALNAVQLPSRFEVSLLP